MLKNNRQRQRVLFVGVLFLFLSFTLLKNDKPTIYIIGDSTVQNSDGNGQNAYWGWGSLIYPYFDTTVISIRNHAKPGTSTRTFILDGRWDKVMSQLKKGDFVIMQFGHNDHAGVDDRVKQKGTLLGIGDSTREIISIRTHKPETVHTYGWYLKKLIQETKSKGAIPIVCSLVPRNRWRDGQVVVEANYPDWAQSVAISTGAYYINLNRLIAGHWVRLGRDSVNHFFPGDGTHTNLKGAKLNAACVVEGIKGLQDCPIKQYLRP